MNRRKLKGKQVSIPENLIKERQIIHDKCWELKNNGKIKNYLTKEGMIKVCLNNENIIEIKTDNDYNAMYKNM